MKDLLASNWWALVIRGLLAIIFGLVVLFDPAILLPTVIILFAAYALADGVLMIIASLRKREESNWWIHLLEGIVSVVAGIVAYVAPGITLVVLLTLFAAWAIVTGVLEIWAAIELRKHMRHEWLLALSGGASIIFGLLLLTRTGATMLILSVFLAFYWIFFGVMLVTLGLQLRSGDIIVEEKAATTDPSATGSQA